MGLGRSVDLSIRALEFPEIGSHTICLEVSVVNLLHRPLLFYYFSQSVPSEWPSQVSPQLIVMMMTLMMLVIFRATRRRVKRLHSRRDALNRRSIRPERT